MAGSILSLLAIVAAIVWWLIRRNASPEQQNRKRYEQAESDVAKRDGLGASLHGSDDLDELDRVQRAKNPGGGIQ